MKEIEAKFKLKNIQSILKHSDFKVISKNKILDIYFNHPLLKLSEQDKVLRLRKENQNYFIAYKGPREKHQHLLVREEIEFVISDSPKINKFIGKLGFKVSAKAEKIRILLKNKSFKNLAITIDQYPFIGNFLEVEGPEIEIIKFSKKYNFDLKKTSQRNCTEEFLTYCQKNKLTFKNPTLHFTFADEKKTS